VEPRRVHLQAHPDRRTLLTDEQVRRYNKLRGTRPAEVACGTWRVFLEKSLVGGEQAGRLHRLDGSWNELDSPSSLLKTPSLASFNSRQRVLSPRLGRRTSNTFVFDVRGGASR